MENDFIKNEHDILKFWEDTKCFEKLVEKNKDGVPFRFLDGPITANNAMGVHHAWGRSVKDIFLRYKAMNGHPSHYRNGFDAQGLWVEVEVEKELGFKDKKDIENYGMEAFTRKCVERITKYSKVIVDQSKRLGQWMDWENSYYTHTDQNITAIWHFLKVCHQNGWIDKSYKPMPWCPRCGTSLSEHEMTGSHQDITHRAVYAKLPVYDRPFDVLVWTTTPWTLSANVALAVNPDLDYAIVESNQLQRPLVLAKNALGLLGDDKKVIQLIKGKDLVGLGYETFLPHLEVQKDLVHTIVSWDEVAADEGSGVVHIAPGCGAEDYELGKVKGLLEISPIDESGRFTKDYDFLSGLSASEAAPLIFDMLQAQGKLFKTHEYTHSYPVCWRCKSEVLFRLVGSWVIKTDAIRPKLIEAASGVKWEPAFAGKRMQDWLTNMGDWNISRKRFYGLPLPFYPCDHCGHLTVVGSKEELKTLGGSQVDTLPELHRPWVDEIKIKCPVCGELVERVPEVGDVWLDAGITPFSTLGYFTDKEKWATYFPAEWVVEMNEQVRLWFYSLLFMSVTLTGKAPYEKVMTHGSVVQEDGSKFHKSGFMIKFDEAAEKIGADTVRYLYAGANTGNDVRFGYHLGDEARRKLLSFSNIVTFFNTYASIDQPKITDEPSENLMDIWLNNRINLFVEKAVKSYESYHTMELIREFEQCCEDVSNWYVRLCRKRFWKEQMDQDKQSAYNALYTGIKTMCQVMAPVIPFMTEQLWQTTILPYGGGELSVHLSDFPKVTQVDERVLTEVETVREVIANALKLRNENQLKVRQPLSKLYVDSALHQVVNQYATVVKDELNVKDIEFVTDWTALCDEGLVLDFKTAGRVLKGDLNKVKTLLENLSQETLFESCQKVKRGEGIDLEGYLLDAQLFTIDSKEKVGIKMITGPLSVAIHTEITPELKAEGCYRELLRHCQVLRKEAGFQVSDRVKLWFETESGYVNNVVETYKSALERETLSTIEVCHQEVMEKTILIEGDEVLLKIE